MNVRKDVIKRLVTGLEAKRKEADELESSIPNIYSYNTKRASHNIYLSKEEGRYYCNTQQYDGKICHTDISINEVNSL